MERGPREPECVDVRDRAQALPAPWPTLCDAEKIPRAARLAIAERRPRDLERQHAIPETSAEDTRRAHVAGLLHLRPVQRRERPWLIEDNDGLARQRVVDHWRAGEDGPRIRARGLADPHADHAFLRRPPRIEPTAVEERTKRRFIVLCVRIDAVVAAVPSFSRQDLAAGMRGAPRLERERVGRPW